MTRLDLLEWLAREERAARDEAKRGSPHAYRAGVAVGKASAYREIADRLRAEEPAE